MATKTIFKIRFMDLGNMNGQRLSIISILLSLVLVFPSCSNDDEEQTITEPVVASHIKKQIMVVFGPSRLGDRGFADNILSSLFKIPPMADSVDVDFICETSVASTQREILEWASDSIDPVFHERYDHRLLILTETYMLRWLDVLADELQPTDEVLQLKVNEDDLNSTAGCQRLGNRLHGANISAAYSIRRFCKFMDYTAGMAEARNGNHIRTDTILFIHSFEGNNVFFRDSIKETLLEERGEQFRTIEDKVFTIEDDEKWGNGEISLPYGKTFSENISFVTWSIYILSGFLPFSLLDLDAAVNGIDYQLLNTSHYSPLYAVILDASAEGISSPERFYINRDFGRLIYNWGIEWIRNPFATMHRWEIHGGWDGYCKDNFYGYI
ncbi:MAG: hypothetical protein K5683_05340 [Prevotella sp.]|nr:hypothetical protein [Prevotella sp.]